MSGYLGDFAEDATVRFMFTTHAQSGAAVAPSSAFEAADLVIYKDGGATQKATANGVTMTSPFDSTTGLHAVAIDTSNNTGDTDFWVTGSDYTVVLAPDETIDGLAALKVVAHFSIENRVVKAVKGNVTGNLLGNVVGSVGAIGTDGITAASFASNAITSTAVAASAANELADALLDRAAAVAGKTPREALVAAYLAAAAPSSGMTASGGTAVFTEGGKTLQADLDAFGNRSNASHTL